MTTPLHRIARRLLDPEAHGAEIPAHIQDEIRAALAEHDEHAADSASLDPMLAMSLNILANLTGASQAILHAVNQAGGYTPPAGHEIAFQRAFDALQASTVEALRLVTTQEPT